MNGPAADIIGISDVSVGYGSPQVPVLMQSLSDHYSATVVILEPDEQEKEPTTPPSSRCSFERISLGADPHILPGRLEYVTKAARYINAAQPKALVLFCTYTLPVLHKLRFKPALTIYNSSESVATYGPYDVELNRHAAPRVDVITFPEENRAQWDGARCGLLNLPFAILYNAVNPPVIREMVPPPERKKTMIYTGMLHEDKTLARFFLKEEMQDIPIDIFGPAGSKETEDKFYALEGEVRYHGLVKSTLLDEIRKNYAFSIVMWSPDNENQRFACPNKFFEAIADGVPPISTPHPQAKMLLNRYRCGLLMEDWSYAAFSAALKQAHDLFGTDQYAEMVENCVRAVKQELNWEAQFAKLMRLLPRNL